MKARSRLKTVTPEVVPSVAPKITKTASNVAKANPYVYTGADHSSRQPALIHRSHQPTSSLALPAFFQPYLAHLSTLIISLFFYGLVGFIVTRTQPASQANLFLPHLYLPFQLCLFLANWFGFSFLWLNTRRGYLTALAIQVPIFLRLQLIEVTWQLGLGVVILFVIIELAFTYLESRSNPDANFHQKPLASRRRTRA